MTPAIVLLLSFCCDPQPALSEAEVFIVLFAIEHLRSFLFDFDMSAICAVGEKKTPTAVQNLAVMCYF